MLAFWVLDDGSNVYLAEYLQRTELCIESFDNGPPFVVDLHNLWVLSH